CLSRLMDPGNLDDRPGHPDEFDHLQHYDALKNKIRCVSSAAKINLARRNYVMRWDELTSDLFPGAVQKAEGVCLLPLSCIERHGHHLTLATDMLIGREVCNRAAALEPSIVFPDYIFTQILEARHEPGCIGIDPLLSIRLLENVCQEIARNGLKKIVFVNAHGGNDSLIHYFAQIQLASPRDYVIYITEPTFSEQDEATIKAQWAT